MGTWKTMKFQILKAMKNIIHMWSSVIKTSFLFENVPNGHIDMNQTRWNSLKRKTLISFHWHYTWEGLRIIRRAVWSSLTSGITFESFLIARLNSTWLNFMRYPTIEVLWSYLLRIENVSHAGTWEISLPFTLGLIFNLS